mmetsp:Transcript_45356/g.82852  ORF Transcript_45356/g.82852 Transcript_45356/m.82852 type:complete len:424 (-) Transcript_45356:19-1290(-)
MTPPPERYISPLLVLGLHALLVVDVALHRPELQLVVDLWAALAWTSTGLAVSTYLMTVLSDPGMLTRTSRRSAVLAGPAGKFLRCLKILLAPVAVCLGMGLREDVPENGLSRGAREAREVRDVQELQPIGRAALDAISDCGDDPGEETIDLADLEAGSQGPPLWPAAGPDSESGSPRTGIKRREADRKRGVAQAQVDVLPRDSTALGGHKLRFCKVCQMWQPLRTKHCRDCGRCVRTHDHHCPWIGTCVGEGNRLFFFWFLVAQFYELAMFLLQGVWELRRTGIKPTAWIGKTPLLLLGLCMIVLLMIMVGCLLCFHTYLACLNLTTWENISWHNISYLSGIREDASPFSRSLCTNLAVYCCHPWCPYQGCGYADYVKRDEDGWIVWELGEPQNPLADLETCQNMRCGRCCGDSELCCESDSS